MGPLVLNTRPETDSADLEAILTQRGYQVMSAPMLQIEFPDQATVFDPAPYQALIFTSANGVRAFARLSDDRARPVLCVGDATARLAAQIGFDQIKSANGDINDLADLIRDQIDPEKGPLFHPAARKTAGDLGQILADGGYKIDRQTVYTAHASTSLAEQTANAIAAHHIDAVLFFSPRTAETFVKLIKSAKLEGELCNTRAICLSPAVQLQIADLKWQRTHVASKPTQEYLLSILDQSFSSA
ncbi:uroporphyrinogen-III synthase [Thalassospira lucentensis]|uniref:uroporphyrinogen-III synthase n=1 Tax=Thalassospira lucentensis TaxID=168935 RepID=UPI003AA92815